MKIAMMLSVNGQAITLSKDFCGKVKFRQMNKVAPVVAAKLKANPTCKIVLFGYPEASKASQANCQKRVEALRRQLVEKEGISADRITVDCNSIGGGDKNTVDIKCP